MPAATDPRSFVRTLCNRYNRRGARFEARVWDTRELGWSARVSLPTGIAPGTPFAASEIWVELRTFDGAPVIQSVTGVAYTRGGLAEDTAAISAAADADARRAAECLAGMFAAELAVIHAAWLEVRRADVAAKIVREAAAGDLDYARALALAWGIELAA